ncbi:MAG: hypothetical protein FVQ83_02980 [Chloroflexi bacterium]|nr:hypothetical protein [Chloroflexota bacterium]
MEKRNIGIIATIASALLCGCPGVCFFLFGGLFTFTGSVEDPSAYGITTAEGDLFTMGIIFLGVGLVMAVIPLAIGIFTFWPQRKAKIENFEGPIPPAL